MYDFSNLSTVLVTLGDGVTSVPCVSTEDLYDSLGFSGRHRKWRSDKIRQNKLVQGRDYFKIEYEPGKGHRCVVPVLLVSKFLGTRRYPANLLLDYLEKTFYPAADSVVPQIGPQTDEPAYVRRLEKAIYDLSVLVAGLQNRIESFRPGLNGPMVYKPPIRVLHTDFASSNTSSETVRAVVSKPGREPLVRYPIAALPEVPKETPLVPLPAIDRRRESQQVINGEAGRLLGVLEAECRGNLAGLNYLTEHRRDFWDIAIRRIWSEIDSEAYSRLGIRFSQRRKNSEKDHYTCAEEAGKLEELYSLIRHICGSEERQLFRNEIVLNIFQPWKAPGFEEAQKLQEVGEVSDASERPAE